MATPAEIQLELDPQSTNKKLFLQRKFTVGTTDTWFCLGGVVRPGAAKWVTSTNTDSAAAQATSITNAMTA